MAEEVPRWKNLSTLVQVTRRRTILATDRTTEETSYYICSNRHATAEQVGMTVRKHWSIENGLHWVLDMGFSEYQSRHRAGNCADNFARMRHFAYNLLKAEKTNKLGIANKRKHAGWSMEYLFKVLTGA